MANLLFATPWWLPTLLIGVGAVLFWNGNRRQESRVRNAGLLFVAVAVVLVTVSYLVDTDLEKATKQTKQLVRDVEERNWSDFKSILDPLASLQVFNAGAIYNSRDEIVAGGQRAVDRYGVKNVRILSTTSEQNDTLITITMTIYSEHEATMGHPITSTWQFEWQQTGDNWALSRIINVKIGNLSANQAGSQFPRP